jgi:hypothetical protein
LAAAPGSATSVAPIRITEPVKPFRTKLFFSIVLEGSPLCVR